VNDVDELIDVRNGFRQSVIDNSIDEQLNQDISELFSLAD